MALSVLNMPQACWRQTTTTDHPTSRLLFVHSLKKVVQIVSSPSQSSPFFENTVTLRVHLQNILLLMHLLHTSVQTHGHTLFA